MSLATRQAPDRMPSRQDVQPKRPPESRYGTAPPQHARDHPEAVNGTHRYRRERPEKTPGA